MNPKVNKFLGNMCIPVMRVFIFLFYWAEVLWHRATGRSGDGVVAKDCWNAARITAIFTLFPEEERSINAAMDDYLYAVKLIDDLAAQFYSKLAQKCTDDKFLVDSQLTMSLLSPHHRTIVTMTLLSDMCEKLYWKILTEGKGKYIGFDLRMILQDCAADEPRCFQYRYERASASAKVFVEAANEASPTLLMVLQKHPDLCQRLIVRARGFYFTPEEVWEITGKNSALLGVGDTVLYANVEDKVAQSFTNGMCAIVVGQAEFVKSFMCRTVDREGVKYLTVERHYRYLTFQQRAVEDCNI